MEILKNLKKGGKQKLYVLLTILVVLINVSCEIGLGASVDTEAPGLEISAPPADSVIRGTFTLSGKWNDDGAISGISVNMTRLDTGTSYKFTGSTSTGEKGSGSWKAVINPEEKGLADGTYEAIVSISDNGGHTTSMARTLTVDNTAPVLILTKPTSTPAAAGEAEPTLSVYGKSLFLEGSIADTTKETWIEMKFYSNAACTEESYLYTIETDLIAPTNVNQNNSKFAVYEEDSATQKLVENAYRRIYGKDENSGAVPVYAKIRVYDTAETYSLKESGNGKKEDELIGSQLSEIKKHVKGNSTEVFYVSTELADGVTKSKTSGGDGLAPIDIYTILNGTQEIKEASRSADGEKGITKQELEKKLEKKGKTISAFSINPNNSPYYTISGLKTLTGSGSDFTNADSGYYVKNGSQTLEVSVFMGSDSFPLDETDSEFYVYLLECNEKGEPVKADTAENRIKLYSKYGEFVSESGKQFLYKIGGKEGHKTTSGAFVFAVPMSKSVNTNTAEGVKEISGLVYGKNYLIRVNGKDSEGNAVDNEVNRYGFHFSPSGAAPEITIKEPSKIFVNKKKGDSFTIKGEVKSEESDITLAVEMNGEKYDTALHQTQTPNIYEFEYEIPASKFNQNESDQYQVAVRAAGENSSASYLTVSYDVEGPEITISGEEPVIETKDSQGNVTLRSINGDFVLSGIITDKYDVFGSASYSVVQEGVVKAEGIIPAKFSGESAVTVHTTQLEDKKNIKVIISAKDRSGNETIKELGYFVDQETDRPVISSESEGINLDAAEYSQIITAYNAANDWYNSFQHDTDIYLNVDDDDGVIALVSFDLERYDTDSTTHTAVASGEKEETKYYTPGGKGFNHRLPDNTGVFLATVRTYDRNCKEYIHQTAGSINIEENKLRSTWWSEKKFFIRITGNGPDVTVRAEKEYVSTKDGAVDVKVWFDVKDTNNGPYTLIKDGTPVSGQVNVNSPLECTLHYDKDSVDRTEIKFTVKDYNNVATIKPFTMKFDNGNPTVMFDAAGGYPLTPERTEDANFFFKGNYTDSGTAPDEASGVKKVSIRFTDGEYTQLAAARAAAETNTAVSTPWLDAVASNFQWNYDATWKSDDVKAAFASEGKKTVIVKAEDGAGNVSYDFKSFTYDVKAPEITQISGKDYTSAGSETITVECRDTNPAKLEIKIYSKDGTLLKDETINISDSDKGSADSDGIYTASVSYAADLTGGDISSGSHTYSIKVTAEDENGRKSKEKTFDIIRDTKGPEIENINISTTSVQNKVWYDQTNDRYFVNNKNQTFTISGITRDNIGVKDVKLKVTAVNTDGTRDEELIIQPAAATTQIWSFAGLSFASDEWSAKKGAVAEISAEDKAGNKSALQTINIIFDVKAPVAEHKIDDLLKDLEFRLNDYKNDAGEPDVGGKYAGGTYASAYTMQIRGNYADNDGGAGISKYYYKTFNNQEVVIDSSKATGTAPVTGSEEDEGKIFFNSRDALRNWVKANKTDIFSPLTDTNGNYTTESKNVEYNIEKNADDDYDYAQNNEKVKKWGGTETGDSKTVEGKEYLQFRTSINSNYKTTIKGFKEGKNSLVIVAEDNVGNLSLDYADVGGVIYPCYSLNVDVTAPTVPKKHEGTVYTNVIKKAESGEENPDVKVEIMGTVSDKAGNINGSSGIDEIVFTSDQNNEKVTLKAEELEEASAVEREKAEDPTLMKWKVDIRSLLSKDGTAIITATVTDKAKLSTPVPVANITVDRTPPEFALTTPQDGSYTGTSLTIGGTANAGNGAPLSSDSFVLYYRTAEPEKDSEGNYKIPVSSEGWTQLDNTIPAGNEWKKENIAVSDISEADRNTPLYFTVSGKDTSGTGNTGYARPRKITIDRKKPEFVSGSVGGKADDAVAAAWYKDTTLNITGSFSDDGSGVSTIYYRVGAAGELQSLSTTNGSYSTSVSGFAAGENVLKVWAEDAAGNPMAETDAKTYTVHIDSKAPEITPVNTVFLINGKTDKDLSFYVTENESGLKSADDGTISPSAITVTIGSASVTPSSVTFGDADEDGKRLVTVTISKDTLKDLSNYNTVLAKATDNAKWESSPQPIGILNKDGDPPEIDFSASAEKGSEVNKTITIGGKATDANEVTELTLTAVCGNNQKEYKYEKSAAGGNSINYRNSSWTAVIDTTELDDSFTEEGKDVKFSLNAKDNAGNETETAAELTLKINQNTDRPVITIGSGVDFTKKNADEIWVKGSSTIYGSVTDDDGIANGGFKIYRKAKDDINFTDASASYSGGSWNVKLPKDDSYILKFEVKDKGKFADSATGELKETGTSFVSADINASGSGTDAQLLATPIIEDSPEATEQNQNPTPNKLGNTMANGNTLIPVCLDTQAPTLKIEAVSYDKSVWVEDINKSDFYLGGKKNTFYVKVKASDSSGLAESNPVRAVFTGSMDVTEESTKVVYKLKCPADACTVESVTGTTDEFIIKVTNFDTACHPDDETKTKPFSGTLLLTITAEDKAELTTDKQLSRTIDNAEPVIKITAPVAVTSTATVTGNIEGETVNPSVYYMVTPDDTQPDSESEYWKHESFASLAYSIYFDGTSSTTGTHTDLFRTYLTKAPVNAATSEQIANNEYKKLTDVYVWIKAVDVCGNESYEKAKVVVDPQGNRPTVNVTYPDIDGIKLGGTIRLMGTASDNVEVKYVWIKLDTNKDSEWTVADYTKLAGATNSAYTFGQISTNKKLGTGEGEVNITPSVSNISDIAIMVKVSGGSSWNLTVNADGELIPDGAADNTVTMWASATDDDKKDGSSIQESTPVVRSFTVDKNNPYFIQDTLRLTREADSQTYKEGMSVRGVWYLEGTVVDDSSGIKKITVKLEGSDTDTIYINKYAANPVVEVTKDDYQFRQNTTIRAGTVNYDFKIKVGEATGVGKKSFRITAYEDTENNLSAYKDFLVRYDNEKPVLATQDSEAFKISKSVQNDQGYYSLESRAYERNDGDTGVNRIAVYFTRKKGDKTYIFDPMYKRGYTPESGSDVSMMETGTTLAQDSGTDGDKLYWGTASATSISSKTLTLSSPAASYVHAGGLAKVKGVIYRIESVSDNTVVLDEEPGNTTEATDVKFAVANVVDNTDPESKAEHPEMITDSYGYGYCSNFVYDDGDKIMEKLHKDDSTSWTWNLWVNSKNIPDGDVDIHYVVFDKAGNSRHDVIENASVINNRPRLVSVALGIDVNQDGDTADTGETVNYYPDGKEGLADKPVKYSNAKETINISGITVKGKMTVTPEIVGGNGNLFYQWKTKGQADWHKVETNTNSPDEPAPLMSGNDNYDDTDFNNANDYIASGASSLTNTDRNNHS